MWIWPRVNFLSIIKRDVACIFQEWFADDSDREQLDGEMSEIRDCLPALSVHWNSPWRIILLNSLKGTLIGCQLPAESRAGQVWEYPITTDQTYSLCCTIPAWIIQRCGSFYFPYLCLYKCQALSLLNEIHHSNLNMHLIFPLVLFTNWVFLKAVSHDKKGLWLNMSTCGEITWYILEQSRLTACLLEIR